MAASAYYDAVQKLYIAYYGRPADPLGQEYWASKIDAAGGKIEDVVNAFGNSAEAQTIYDSFGTAVAVNNVYHNIFGRDADTAGLTFYANEINSGKITLAQLAQAIIAGAQGSDATVVANKLAVANTFTAHVDTAAEIVNYNGDAAAQEARDFLSTVTADPASVTSATANVDSTIASLAGTGSTFTLTVGVDTIAGTAGNDVINALTVNAATGDSATTLNGFDSIDGGNGNDTLNIYTDGDSHNGTLASSATIKNVETINIYNDTVKFNTGVVNTVDASKFVGATAINQNGLAANVINLAAGTTAGFNGITANAAAALTVTAADAAAAAAVSLSGVKGDAVTGLGTVENQAVLNVGGKALNAVTVSGSLAQTTTAAGANDASLLLNVTAGKDVETLTVNTAVKTTLTAAHAALDGSTKALSTVDASASTGDIDYAAATTVATVKTGAGADDVVLQTAFTSTVKAASVSTGAGDDHITVSVDNTPVVAAGATAAVDAGDGNDTIDLNIDANVVYTVNAGAGNDTVNLVSGTIKTTDSIDGGAGTDTVALNGQAAYVADDYIVLNKVLKNFEAIEFTTAAGSTTAFDASQVASYKSFTFDAGGQITKVAADQALVTADDLTAHAAGYVAGDNTATPATTTTYAGSLNVTASGGTAATVIIDPVTLLPVPVPQNDTTVNAFASSIALTAKATTVDSYVGLTGDVQSATVTLVNSVNSDTAPTADTIAHFDLTTATTATKGAFTALGGLTSLTLSGNGSATVVNADGTALTTVDASQLGGVYTLGADKGAAIAGLHYSSLNAAAETIKLGAGLDTVALGASTYGKVDTVTGLNLVLNAAGTDLDVAKSDVLNVTGFTAATAEKFTTTQTDLDLALKDAAAYSAAHSGHDLVFQVSGNTYVFHDGGSSAGLIDSTDTVVKLAGTVDLDALLVSLAHVA